MRLIAASLPLPRVGNEHEFSCSARFITATTPVLPKDIPVPLEETNGTRYRVSHTVNGYGRYTYVTASIHEKTRDRGTSLADCACLALALSRGLPAVTEEKTWEACDVGVPVIRIR